MLDQTTFLERWMRSTCDVDVIARVDAAWRDIKEPQALVRAGKHLQLRRPKYRYMTPAKVMAIINDKIETSPWLVRTYPKGVKKITSLETAAVYVMQRTGRHDLAKRKKSDPIAVKKRIAARRKERNAWHLERTQGRY